MQIGKIFVLVQRTLANVAALALVYFLAVAIESAVHLTGDLRPNTTFIAVAVIVVCLSAWEGPAFRAIGSSVVEWVVMAVIGTLVTGGFLLLDCGFQFVFSKGSGTCSLESMGLGFYFTVLVGALTLVSVGGVVRALLLRIFGRLNPQG
jgi:hypothetical protein